MSFDPRRHALLSVVALAFVLIAGCGGGPKTSVTQVWKGEVAAPPLKSILVFGARMDEANRRVVEDAMVAELRRRQIAARPSYELFPGALPDRDKARDAVKAAGIEGVLVATLRNVREQSTVMPSTYYGGTGLWSSYYGGPAWGYWDPGYVVTDRLVSFETTLWSERTGDQLLWAAMTETKNPSAGKEFANSLTKAVIASLENEGLVPKQED